MNKIGFKNFRRFTDFPDLEYGPITFLVGRNNAGKSTLVKALLLIDNYLKSKEVNKFDFTSSVLEDVNIVTFGRAKNYNSNKQDSITFNYRIQEFSIFIEITGNDDDTQADVITLLIKDLQQGFYFEFKPQIKDIIVGRSKVDGDKEDDATFKTLDDEINWLKNSIKNSKAKKASKEYIELVDRLNQLEDRKKFLGKSIENKEEASDSGYSEVYQAETTFDVTKGIAEIIEPVKNQLTGIYRLAGSDQADEDEKRVFDEYRGFYEDRDKIERSLKNFIKHVLNDPIIYLGANSVKQKSLFYIKDTLNPLSQAINEFKQLGVDKKTGSTALAFTKKWMDELEVGEDFEIIMHAGEAYEVKIESHNTKIQLADKGMGSVQAMLLILRLACIIDKYGDRDVVVRVIIEEPELNLHPLLQGKLAEMFLFVNELKRKRQVKCEVEFIIETHSEYLIRKTQLLVKENEFEVKPNVNPFCVLYFDKDMKQWKMNYREDGVFIENFGSGFFDVATKDALSLLKRKKENNG